MVNQKWIFSESVLYGGKKGEFWSLNLCDETVSHSRVLTLIKNILKYCASLWLKSLRLHLLQGCCVEASSLLRVSDVQQHHWFCPHDHWLLTPDDPAMGSSLSPQPPGLTLHGFVSSFGLFVGNVLHFCTGFSLGWIVLPINIQMLLSLWHTLPDHPCLKFHPSSWFIFLLSPYHNLTHYTFLFISFIHQNQSFLKVGILVPPPPWLYPDSLAHDSV